MALSDFIAQLLGQQQPGNRLAYPGNIALSRFDGQGAMSDPGVQAFLAGQGGQQQGASVAPEPPMPAAAPQSAPRASGGGILGNLFGGANGGRNETIDWLKKQGMDEGTATIYANNKPALQQYLLARSKGADPKDGLMAVGADSTIYDANSGQWITPPNRKEDDGYTLLSAEEVAGLGLPPGSYQRSAEGKIDPVVSVRDQDADFGRLQDVRKEIQQLPSYKNFAQAAPIYDTMVDAASRDSKAADLNLVYGLGKIFDPGSVVREGEMVMVKDTASLPDWLVGAINGLNGGARLQAETRRAILEEAKSRITAYKTMLDGDMVSYRKLADHFNLDPNFLLPPMPELRDLPPVTAGPQGALPPPPALTAPPAAPAAPPAPMMPPAPATPPGGGVIDYRDWLAPGRKR